MKNLNKTVLKAAAAAVKKTSKVSASQSCWWWDYELKMPKSVKKMRKF